MSKILKMVEDLIGEHDLYGFYRSVYKGTACGPTIGFCLNGTWVYCSELPDKIKVPKFCHSCRHIEHNVIDYDEFMAQDHFECPLAEDEELASINKIDVVAYAEDDNYAEKCPAFSTSVVSGVSVSSIVEGSDVEVDGYKLYEEDFSKEKFWEALEAVDKEADFYWERDNSTWLQIYEDKKVVAHCHWEQFDSKPKWDCSELSKNLQKFFEKTIGTHFDTIVRLSDAWNQRWDEPINFQKQFRCWHNKKRYHVVEYFNDTTYY